MLEAYGEEGLARTLATLPDLREVLDPIQLLATPAPEALARRPGLVAAFDCYRPVSPHLEDLARSAGSYRANWDPWDHAQDFLGWEASTPAERLAEAAWWACAHDAGVSLFLDAWQRAELTFPRRIRSWHQAQQAAHDSDGRGWSAWDHVRDAAAAALMDTSDQSGLWARATARIAAELPVWWETFERELRVRFAHDSDTAFASADQYLSAHANKRRVIAALASVCGAALALTTNVVKAKPRTE